MNYMRSDKLKIIICPQTFNLYILKPISIMKRNKSPLIFVPTKSGITSSKSYRELKEYISKFSKQRVQKQKIIREYKGIINWYRIKYILI